MNANARTIEHRIEQSEWAEPFRPSKKLALLALFLLSGVFAVSVLFAPVGGDYFTICGFKNLTGLPCPGCGLTHSFCAMGKGDVLRAFGYNLLGPPLFLVFALLWIRSMLVMMNRNRLVFAFDQLAERFQLARAFAIAFIVFGTARILYDLLLKFLALRG
jgi:hypothetical protein